MRDIGLSLVAHPDRLEIRKKPGSRVIHGTPLVVTYHTRSGGWQHRRVDFLDQRGKMYLFTRGQATDAYVFLEDDFRMSNVPKDTPVAALRPLPKKQVSREGTSSRPIASNSTGLDSDADVSLWLFNPYNPSSPYHGWQTLEPGLDQSARREFLGHVESQTQSQDAPSGGGQSHFDVSSGGGRSDYDLSSGGGHSGYGEPSSGGGRSHWGPSTQPSSPFDVEPGRGDDRDAPSHHGNDALHSHAPHDGDFGASVSSSHEHAAYT